MKPHLKERARERNETAMYVVTLCGFFEPLSYFLIMCYHLDSLFSYFKGFFFSMCLLTLISSSYNHHFNQLKVISLGFLSSFLNINSSILCTCWKFLSFLLIIYIYQKFKYIIYKNLLLYYFVCLLINY